jgi:hypothetical protein
MLRRSFAYPVGIYLQPPQVREAHLLFARIAVRLPRFTEKASGTPVL